MLLSTRLGEVTHSLPASLPQMVRVVRHPVIVACIPALVGYLIVEQSMTMFLPALLEARWAASTTLATAAGALFWGGIIVGRFGVMALTRRLGESQIIAAAGLVMGSCVVVVAMTTSLTIALPAIVIAGIAGGPIVPLGIAWATRGLKQSTASAITCCQLACCAGGLLGPFVTGTLADTIGLPWAIAIAGVIVAQGVFPIAMSLLAAEPYDHNHQVLVAE